MIDIEELKDTIQGYCAACDTESNDYNEGYQACGMMVLKEIEKLSKEKSDNKDLKDNDLLLGVDEILKSCEALGKEIEASKKGLEFLLNEYKTNKHYFRTEPGRVTIEDVIKTCFEFGWASKRQFDYDERK